MTVEKQKEAEVGGIGHRDGGAPFCFNGSDLSMTS